ncbi:MAG: FkbM family methyltransferase [Daejeonella sp.]|uniref:FkbM family methyltransferase n=1 Tax=Daejeonella sp. TaxID=2805397 RepID=UPI0027355E67|nr:FkbM family methyltransferase [Daejeonella sp.]MDP3468948.1 FkbM family methyltransferase [Daejeonella sp.]
MLKLKARSNEFITIDIEGISELIRNLNNKRIHLIKMDCEGAEYEIIKALDVGLVSEIEIILFESTESVYDLSELLDHLRSIGFSIEFKENSCNYIARNLKFVASKLIPRLAKSPMRAESRFRQSHTTWILMKRLTNLSWMMPK